MIQASSLAKINLCLHVVGRRDDGYHLLQSLVAFAAIGDALSVSPHPALTLEVTGPFAPELGSAQHNLVLRAATRLREAYRVTDGASIILQKNLPVASGMGGGSGDAACALHLLEKHWNLKTKPSQMKALAFALGADIPACLISRAGWLQGIGEEFTPLQHFPKAYVVLVNPRVPMPTDQIFASYRRRQLNFSPPLSMPNGFSTVHELAEFIGRTTNDLSADAVVMYPEIAQRLSSLNADSNVLVARLSGSGATCFGVCATERDAREAAEHLAASFPDDWIEVASLR